MESIDKEIGNVRNGDGKLETEVSRQSPEIGRGNKRDNRDSDTGSNNNRADTGYTGADRKRKDKTDEKSVTKDLEWIAKKPELVEIPNDGEAIPKVKKERKPRESKKKLLDTKENLVQIFSVVSAFAGDIWKIDEQEAEIIAKPLDSILSRYNLLAKTEKYGDIVSLSIALTAVFLPRVLYTVNNIREKRKKEYKDANTARTVTDTDRTTNDRDAEFDTSNIKNVLYELSN